MVRLKSCSDRERLENQFPLLMQCNTQLTGTTMRFSLLRDIIQNCTSCYPQDVNCLMLAVGQAACWLRSMKNIPILLRAHARTGSEPVLRMVRGTLEGMARGGIYDQLAGGFARYSVDAGWVVPHFEKMLYDNALLLRVYSHLWRATGAAWARRVADETAAFLVRDLGTADGGFASALDADTDGVEGLSYVWTPAQLREALGDDDGAWAAGVFA